MQIYVGNLPNGYRLSDLVQIFETYGCVSRASAVRDFAFLAIFDNEAARAAVNGLNGSTFGDQEIVVEQARFFPRTRFPNNTRGGVARGGGVSQQGREEIGEDGYPVAASRSYYVNHEEGYQGDAMPLTHEGFIEDGQAQQQGGNYSQEETNSRGRGFGRGGPGGRRGGFRRGRGARRGTARAYRGNGADGQSDAPHQSGMEAHPEQFQPLENGVAPSGTQVNKASEPARAQASVVEGANVGNSASENNVAHEGEHSAGNARGGRGGRRGGRGRGARGARGAARGESGGQQQQQAPGQVAPLVQPAAGGSGDNNRKVEVAPLISVQPAGDAVVGDKGLLNGGSGDMRVNQNVAAVN